MKVGKIPVNVLKRQVLKRTNPIREEVTLKAGIGGDFAAIKLKQNEQIVLSTNPVSVSDYKMVERGIIRAINNVVCSLATPIGVQINVFLPDRTLEDDLRNIMQEADKTCRKLDLEVIGGHTEVTTAVERILLSITGVGKVDSDRMISCNNIKPNVDVVMTKAIALEGTSILATEKREELLKHLPEHILEAASSFIEEMSIVKEILIAGDDAIAIHDISEGGIYGALWEMAEASQVGLDIDLRKISIRQETVEICEHLGINPYKLFSGGSALIATNDGEALVEKLKEADIEAALIGRTTDSNDRILNNDGVKRFLETPGRDELYQVIGGRK